MIFSNIHKIIINFCIVSTFIFLMITSLIFILSLIKKMYFERSRFYEDYRDTTGENTYDFSNVRLYKTYKIIKSIFGKSVRIIVRPKIDYDYGLSTEFLVLDYPTVIIIKLISIPEKLKKVYLKEQNNYLCLSTSKREKRNFYISGEESFRLAYITQILDQYFSQISYIYDLNLERVKGILLVDNKVKIKGKSSYNHLKILNKKQLRKVFLNNENNVENCRLKNDFLFNEVIELYD